MKARWRNLKEQIKKPENNASALRIFTGLEVFFFLCEKGDGQ